MAIMKIGTYTILVGVLGLLLAACEPNTRSTSPSSALGSDADQIFWDDIKESQNPSYFLDYIVKFPNGKHIEEAYVKMDEIQQEYAGP